MPPVWLRRARPLPGSKRRSKPPPGPLAEPPLAHRHRRLLRPCESMYESTSPRVMRPPCPVPLTADGSSPCSLRSLRTTGERSAPAPEAGPPSRLARRRAADRLSVGRRGGRLRRRGARACRRRRRAGVGRSLLGRAEGAPTRPSTDGTSISITTVGTYTTRRRLTWLGRLSKVVSRHHVLAHRRHSHRPEARQPNRQQRLWRRRRGSLRRR